MIGWVLRKGFQSATGAKPTHAQDDATDPEGPDTPAPVFAARAFKRAVFGTPVQQPKSTPRRNGSEACAPKPPGILLTPGTGTSRRKTVTFHHDVKASASMDSLVSAAGIGNGRRARPRRTRLNETLEKSRRTKRISSVTGLAPSTSESFVSSDEEWTEDSDDASDMDKSTDDGTSVCDHEATVDLNDPRSQSGLYWKSSFEKYHNEANIEMEKLVRYKQLAKSYAKKKDEEAMELRMRLKEEQDKVMGLKEEIAVLLANSATRSDALSHDELDDLLKDCYAEETSKTGKVGASLRTKQTIIDTRKELRKARSQLRELDETKERLDRSEMRNKSLNEEIRRLREEVVASRDLERQVRVLKAEVGRQEEQYNNLMNEYDTMKDNAKARHGEATWVMQQKDDEISELKKKVRALKIQSLDVGQAPRRQDDPLLAECAKWLHELKLETELLGPSRKKSLGKKADAIAANLKALGYSATLQDVPVAQENNVGAGMRVTGPAEKVSIEKPLVEKMVHTTISQPTTATMTINDPILTEPSESARNAKTRRVISQATKQSMNEASIRAVDSDSGMETTAAPVSRKLPVNRPRPKSMIDTASGNNVNGEENVAVQQAPVAVIENNKLALLHERRQRRWGNTVSRDQEKWDKQQTVKSRYHVMAHNIP